MVECIACGGEGVDDSGELVISCPACGGRGSLTWRRVLWLGLESRYDPLVQLEQGRRVVEEATEVVR